MQQRRPHPNPAVVLREEFDDWALLFNPDTADVVGLNPVGVAIWSMIDGETTLAEIVGRLGERFEEVPADAAEHLRAFVDDLAARGFLAEEV